MALLLVMVGYFAFLTTKSLQRVSNAIMKENVSSLKAAEELELALFNQKGFVASYFLDGNPEWLKHLGEYRQIFRDRLAEARSLVSTEAEKNLIDRIESEYTGYITLKDRVIEFYTTGQREQGAELHKRVRIHFFKVLEFTEEYKNLYAQKISRIRDTSYAQAKKLRVVAGTAVL